MKKYPSTIVAALDLSRASKQVIAAAQDIAKHSKARIIFVVVIESAMNALDRVSGTPSATLAQEITSAQQNLKKLLRTVKVRHEAVVLSGNPSIQIRRLANEEKADLIIVGSHGKGMFSRLLLGSVSDAITRESLHPVLVIKGRYKPVRKIFVPVDGTDGSLEALEAAANMARLMKAKLQPASIVEFDFVPSRTSVASGKFYETLSKHRIFDMVRWLKLKASKTPLLRSIVRIGRASTDLPDLAAATKSDLVVMSTHSRKGLGLTLLGRVTAQMLHRANCSILVIRPSGWRYKAL